MRERQVVLVSGRPSRLSSFAVPFTVTNSVTSAAMRTASATRWACACPRLLVTSVKRLTGRPAANEAAIFRSL